MAAAAAMIAVNACGTGVVKVVQLLLANGAEVDLRDKEGYTPLHLASGYMQVPVIRALIDAGADPEVEDKDGRSPLALVESLRDNLPDNNPTVFSRKLPPRHTRGNEQSIAK